MNGYIYSGGYLLRNAIFLSKACIRGRESAMISLEAEEMRTMPSLRARACVLPLIPDNTVAETQTKSVVAADISVRDAVRSDTPDHCLRGHRLKEAPKPQLLRTRQLLSRTNGQSDEMCDACDTEVIL